MWNYSQKFYYKDIQRIGAVRPLTSWCFTIILFGATLMCAYVLRKKTASLLTYKKALKNSQNRLVFLFEYFFSRVYAHVFTILFADNSAKYMKYVEIEGSEYVWRLKDEKIGVIVLSGHFEPVIQTSIFKQVFEIPISSMASVENKQLLKKTTAKIWRLVSSLPIYAVGEERQLLIGLLQRKEWINILNDVPVNTKHVFSKTLLGEKVRFSVFPFKVALNHDIPILFIGVTRVRHHYHITIEPIADFSTEEEGLKQYLVAIENMLDRDPFTAFGIAESFVSPL